MLSPQEDCKSVVINLLEEHTGLKVDSHEISVAHRIGKKTPNRNENIIFKLCRRDAVDEIFNTCKEKRPPFFVNCSLTPLRNKLFYAVRQLKKKFPSKIQGHHAQRGDIVVFLAQNNSSGRGRGRGAAAAGGRSSTKRFILNTRSELEEFTKKYLKFELANLSIDW